MRLRERFIIASVIFITLIVIGSSLSARQMLLLHIAHAAPIVPICPTGTTLQNGLCVDGSACPQDFTFKNGKCEKSTPPTCPSGYTGPDAQGQCTKTTKTNACPPNTTFEAGECKTTTATPATCPSGSPDSSGQCTSTTTTPAKCSSMDSIPDSQGQCTITTATPAPPCPSGTELKVDGSCGGDATCPAPLILSSFDSGGSQKTACAYSPGNYPPTCSYGTTLDESGICVDGQPTCPSGTSPASYNQYYCESPSKCSGTFQYPNCLTTTTTPATCPQGYTLQGAQCVSTTRTNACPLDTTYQNGECIKITTTSATCPSGTTGPDSNGQCTSTTTTTATCPQDATLVNGNCVTVTQISCPTGTSPDSTGTCVAQPSVNGPCDPSTDPNCTPQMQKVLQCLQDLSQPGCSPPGGLLKTYVDQCATQACYIIGSVDDVKKTPITPELIEAISKGQLQQMQEDLEAITANPLSTVAYMLAEKYGYDNPVDYARAFTFVSAAMKLFTPPTTFPTGNFERPPITDRPPIPGPPPRH